MSWLSILAILMAVTGILIGGLYTVCQDKKQGICDQYWRPAEIGAKVFLANVKTNTGELFQRSKDAVLDYYNKYMNKETSTEKKTPENTKNTGSTVKEKTEHKEDVRT